MIEFKVGDSVNLNPHLKCPYGLRWSRIKGIAKVKAIEDTKYPVRVNNGRGESGFHVLELVPYD